MEKVDLRFLARLASFPRIKQLSAALEDMPTEAEFSDLLAWAGASLVPAGDGEFEFTDLDWEVSSGGTTTAPVPESEPVPCLTKSQRISIRIPTKILHQIKARARAKGIKYQTLVNQTLKAAAMEWEKAATAV